MSIFREISAASALNKHRESWSNFGLFSIKRFVDENNNDGISLVSNEHTKYHITFFKQLASS